MSNIFDIADPAAYAFCMSDLAWIGASVAQRRAELGLTQATLAQLAGLSRATVNGLERGTVPDLSIGRLGRLLQVLGTQLQLVPRGKRGDAAGDRAALQMAAQTASVSYGRVLPGKVLANALATGVLPPPYLAHFATLLDESPLPVIVAAVEAASRRAAVPPALVWKHVGQWARELKSSREEWHGL